MVSRPISCILVNNSFCGCIFREHGLSGRHAPLPVDRGFDIGTCNAYQGNYASFISVHVITMLNKGNYCIFISVLTILTKMIIVLDLYRYMYTNVPINVTAAAIYLYLYR